MKTGKHTKLQMVRYVRRLFKLRCKTSRTAEWDCVLRGNQLTVIRSFTRGPMEKVIINCLLEPGQLPSLLSIYCAVRESWQVLGKVNVEISSSLM